MLASPHFCSVVFDRCAWCAHDLGNSSAEDRVADLLLDELLAEKLSGKSAQFFKVISTIDEMVTLLKPEQLRICFLQARRGCGTLVEAQATAWVDVSQLPSPLPRLEGVYALVIHRCWILPSLGRKNLKVVGT